MQTFPKGQRLSFIENMYLLYYIFLTKEAREEWRSYTEEQKKKESKTSPPAVTDEGR